MTQSQNILSLSDSMELTMDKGNLSVLGDLGEVAIDAVMNDGILRDVPILRTVVGVGKCLRKVTVCKSMRLADNAVSGRSEEWGSKHGAEYRYASGDIRKIG